MKKTQFDPDLATAAAGNGLLDRRSFVRGGSAFAAAFTGYTFTRPAAAEALTDDPWSLAPGGHVAAPYGQPSRFEGKVVRTISNPSGAPGGGGHARLCTCCREPSRQMACISLSRAAYPMSIPASTAW